MATQNHSLYSGGSSGMLDQDNGYDSEEEFIDDTQFEDPEGFIDEISDEGAVFLVFLIYLKLLPFSYLFWSCLFFCLHFMLACILNCGSLTLVYDLFITLLHAYSMNMMDRFLMAVLLFPDPVISQSHESADCCIQVDKIFYKTLASALLTKLNI